MEILNNWFITAIAYGGGFGAIFFGLFHFLGKSWLENKFQERLNDLKHQQNLEVARLKVEIDSMLTGALRLQEKEFEIFPKVWELIDKCFLQLLMITAPFKSYAEIDKMNDEEVEELLAMTNFTESQKKAVRQANPKSTKYVSYLTFERASDAYTTATDLGTYLSLNGILLPLELKEKCIRVSENLSMISHSVQAKIIHKLPGEIQDYFNSVEELRPAIAEIEANIQKRLASHGKSA